MDSVPATTESGSAFGRALAARARPRVARGFRHDRPRFVGVVARSSVGFGRAVGRSQAIRPAVAFGSLNTPALRPPSRWWQRAEPAEIGTAGSIDDRPTGTTRAAPPSTPTWTDQLLPSSRFERQRREARRTEQATRRTAPAERDFVPTGDTKFDMLKRMLDAGYTPANAPAEMLREPERAPSSRVGIRRTARGEADGEIDRDEIDRDAERRDADGDADWDPSQRRGDTGAGRETAPGSLARLLQPEPVVEGAPHTEGRRSERPGQSAAPPPSPGPLDVPAQSRRRPSPRPTNDRTEALRAMLAEQGEKPVDPRGGEVTHGSAPRPQAATDRVDRSHHDGAPGATPSRGPSTDPDSSPGPTPRDSGAEPNGPGGDPTPAALPDAPQPLAGAGDLRLQRMLSDRPMTVAAPAGVTGAIAAIATVAAPDIDAGHDRATPRRARSVRRVPVLPRESTVDGTPIRRVTLPRAMSVVHRPWARALDDRPGVLATVGAASIGNDRVQTLGADRDGPTAPRHELAPRRASDALTGQGDRAATPSPSLERRPPTESRTSTPAPRRDGDVAPADLTGQTSVAPPFALTPDVTGSQSGTVDAVIRAGTADNVTDIGTTADTVSPGGTADTILRRHQAATATMPLSGRVSTQPAGAHAQLPGRPAPRRRGLHARRHRSIVAPGSGALHNVLRHAVADPAIADDMGPDRHAPLDPEGMPSERVPSARVPSTARDDVSRPPAFGTLPPTESGWLDTDDRSASTAGGPAGEHTVRRAIERSGAGSVESIASPQPTPAASPLPSAPPPGRAARRAAAAAVAERFMDELARSIRTRPAPLPTPFRPMAEAITGTDRVLLSTDAGSRRALRSVGKRAATTGNVIHLDRTPTPGRAINEVIAHELTHVAHPSPTPRFFDDIDDSPEERRAESVARVMASSPLAPTPGVIALVPPTGVDIVRRSPSKEGAQMATADAMASQLTGMPPTSGRTTAPTTGATAGPDTIRRLASGPSSTSSTASAETPAPERAIGSSRSGGIQLGSEAASDWFREELERNIDTIVERLEDRIRIDLERRGGRAWRDV